MVSGTVQFSIFLTMQAPGLHTYIENVESLDILTQKAVRTDWFASYTLPNTNENANEYNFTTPNSKIEVSPSLYKGPGGLTGYLGKVYIGNKVNSFDGWDATGPMIRLHMRTTSNGIPVGLSDASKSLIDQGFTLDISTDKWPRIAPTIWMYSNHDEAVGMGDGMPDNMFLTFKFDNCPTPYQFQFPVSNVSNAADVHIGIQMNVSNQLCATATAETNNTLKFIDTLTTGVLSAQASELGCWAVAATAGVVAGKVVDGVVKLATYAPKVQQLAANQPAGPALMFSGVSNAAHGF